MPTQLKGRFSSHGFGPDVTIEPGVTVGAHTIIHPGTHIGAGTQIGAFCEIGHPTHLADRQELYIGPGSLIRSHSVFYTGSTFGPGLRTGHHVTVRENTHAGEQFQIGTLSDIQGHCRIGDHVRFQSSVHIGQKAQIGDFVFIFPYVVLTNDLHPPSEELEGVTVHDFAVIATKAMALPGSIIGEGALVGAMALVKGEVPADAIYVGNPGKVVGSTSRIKLKNGEPAYPWRRHFHRGYPEQVVAGWLREFATPPESP